MENKSENKAAGRDSVSCYPRIHFAPPFGWMNDPNGLVWHNGIFELYYQSNPNALFWADMTWSHARSRDLLHWECSGAVLFPDENGTMFSGCGLRNDRGLLGLKADTLLFPYTAAKHGDGGPGSSDFTIRLAYSTDGGDTLIKKEGTLLESVSGANRDPKVFWHEESRAYILVLWIRGNVFGIWRSEDLEKFCLSSEIEIEDGFECPDLYCLNVRDEDGRETKEKQWVFMTAGGTYCVGKFDGFTFRQIQPPLKAYAGSLPYAAQSWSGVPGDRVLSIAWLRTLTINNQYTGVMSLPRELSLVKRNDVYLLRFELPAEITGACLPLKMVTADGSISEGKVDYPQEWTGALEDDGALRLHFDSADNAGDFEICLYEHEECLLKFSYASGSSHLFIEEGGTSEILRIVPRSKMFDLDLVYDRGIIEITANGGTYLNILDRPALRSRICTHCTVRCSREKPRAGIIC